MSGLSGGGPPRHLSGGVGFVRGVSGGPPPPPDVRGGPPDNPRNPAPDTPRHRGPPPDKAYLDFCGRGCRSARRFFPRLSLFLKHFVLPVRVCFSARSAPISIPHGTVFSYLAPLCSSRNPERVIRYEPLLYSKITIRVLRTATTVPIRTSPMAAKS